MEEIQAKDKTIQECRTTINSRDNTMQKFIKLNGSHTPNPKEESYNKTILQNMDQCQTLQDEKVTLSEKACVLLDRQIKKLDVKIRDLQNDGVLSKDPPIPSLFNKDQSLDLPKSLFSSESTPIESANSPLNPTSGNASLQFNISQRLNNAAGRVSNAANLAVAQTGPRNSAPASPAAALHLQQRHRESSTGALDSKRRRLNASLGTLPAASSNLRQSSLGPNTPKAGTPGSNRSGSAGPSRVAGGVAKKTTKKVAPHQQVRRLKAANGKPTKRSSSANARLKATSTGQTPSSLKKSPSATGASGTQMDEEEDESILSSADLSDEGTTLAHRNGATGRAMRDSEEMEDEDEDEGGEDTKAYCTCRSVSHGDMVACDNDDCPYEWFHWKCVGLTREPLGTWYCEECRRTLGK